MRYSVNESMSGYCITYGDTGRALVNQYGRFSGCWSFSSDRTVGPIDGEIIREGCLGARFHFQGRGYPLRFGRRLSEQRRAYLVEVCRVANDLYLRPETEQALIAGLRTEGRA